MMFLLAVSPLLLSAIASSQSLTLTDLRFVSDRATTTLITSTSSLPVGEAGYLKAEFTFTSDLQNGSGVYIAAPMRVIWSIADGNGDYVYTDGLSTDAGAEWNGLRYPVYANVTDLNPTTGAGEATIAIPVGTYTPAGSRFPLLPDGSANVAVCVGWEGVIHLDSSAEPADVLGSMEASFGTAWPDVWVGTMSAPPEFADPDYECKLILNSPAPAARTFTLTARPSGIVTVLDTTVVVPQGELDVSFSIQVDNLGTFTLRAKEGGVTVADSAVLEVVKPLVIAQGDEDFFSSPELGDQYASFVEPEPVTGLFKECNAAVIFNPGTQPSVEICGACLVGAGTDSCVNEGGGPVAIFFPGSCTTALDSCTYLKKTVSVQAYAFASKKSVECGSVTFTVTSTPFGLGPSFSTTLKKFQTCCTYEGSSSSPTLSHSITDCED